MPGPKKETSVDIGVITVCPAERRRCLLLGGGWGGVAYAYIHQPSQGLPRCLPTPEPSPPAPCSPCTPSSASSRAVPSRAPPQPGKAKMRLQDRHPPGSSPFPALRTEVPRTLGGGMRRQRGSRGRGAGRRGGERDTPTTTTTTSNRPPPPPPRGPLPDGRPSSAPAVGGLSTPPAVRAAAPGAGSGGERRQVARGF